MVGLVQYKLAKWLAVLLQPVLECHMRNCVKNLFIVTNNIKNCPFSTEDKFICSFNIISLFLGVLLQQPIDIGADALYHNHLSPIHVFMKLTLSSLPMSEELALIR